MYYIRYNGVNEFGMDKGFGKNWAKFPYILEVRSSLAERLPTTFEQAAVTNLQNQAAQQAAANIQKAIVETD